ncbi:cation channel family protein (macronuclear) [Tetrahymena thermophila SB210]|uniref:Cation channel family protein n=1 Tax=Tetrahymena thermophila (strain SB210) TaxID=312017 RepID=I7MHB5_TETTS|nr:cation channel family protein [Tetrahymena thermophila SB210]EAS02796.2 cation channel family protein [Tetrahymena thermophila SB210]|eukprot:XP_001023041.2 cation channel family protein [Tetrahymena thermophila SB210]
MYFFYFIYIQIIIQMSLIYQQIKDDEDFQALRVRKESSIHSENMKESEDEENTQKKNNKDEETNKERSLHINIQKNQQTSTFINDLTEGKMTKYSPMLSPQKDNPNLGFDGEIHSIYQGSGFLKGYKKNPKKLMKAINLLVNVKSFYNQLTKNTRIFQKLTQEQYILIGDNASFYTNRRVQKFSNKKISHYLQLFQQGIHETLRFFQMIPIIQPHTAIKTLWDFFQGVVALIFFGFDMLIQFNTGIVIKGQVEQSRVQIAKQYLRENFIMDVIGITPIFLLNSSHLNEALTQSSSIIQNILYACVIFKCFMLLSIYERIEQKFGYQKNLENFFDLIKLLFKIGSICHFFSLLWFALGQYEIHILGKSNTWIQYKSIQDAGIFTQYIYSFYYITTTMITVGYGDITPQNEIEITFSVLIMYLTSVVYAYSLNCIGNILYNINESHKDFRSDMRTIHQLMEEQNVKQSVRVKISNYVEYLCKESNHQKKAKQDQILSKLSHQLRSELMNEIKGKFISEIPLFKDIIQQQTIAKIIENMEECLFSPGEVIFQHHDQDDCAIYYLLKGQVKISLEDQVHRTVKLIERKGCFGELSFITGNERIGTATANDFCRSYKIKRENFLDIIKQNSQDFENFKMLYESVCLKGNLKFAKLYCYSCKRGDHTAQMCPKTHLIFSKQILIQKYNKSEPITKRTNHSRRKIRYNSKNLYQQVQEALVNIHLVPEYEEIIQIIEKIAHLNDTFLELYYSEEELSNCDAVSNNFNMSLKEIQQASHREKLSNFQNEAYDQSQSRELIDKNNLTPSQSSESDYEDNSISNSQSSSRETTTIEVNSQKENSQKQNKSKKRPRSTRSFAYEMNENIIQESSDESGEDENQNGNKKINYNNQVIKWASKFNQQSEMSAFSVKEQNEDFQFDDQSRKYLKDLEDEFFQKNQDYQNRSSYFQKSRQSMKSINQMNQSSPNVFPKRKSYHKDYSEKSINQLHNQENDSQYMFKNLSSSPIYGHIDNKSYHNQQSGLSNVVHYQNQSIVGFGDFNMSDQNIEDLDQTREKKSNSVSTSKFNKDNISGKQAVGGYRKSVSFDPDNFQEMQKEYIKKQITGSVKRLHSQRSQEQSQRPYKPPSSSFQKIPSVLKNQSSLAIYHSSFNNTQSNILSNQSSQLRKQSTKNFKRQSTNINQSYSNMPSSSPGQQQQTQKGILKKHQNERRQLKPNDMRLILQNEEKLIELYQNQQQQEQDEEQLISVKYKHSKLNQDFEDDKFDCMKNYVYYYPQFNAPIVISNYNQHLNKAQNGLKRRVTIQGKNLKSRIKRVINTKKGQNTPFSGNLVSPTPLLLSNAAIDKGTFQQLGDKSTKTIQYYNNTHIQTNLIQSTEKIISAADTNINSSKFGLSTVLQYMKDKKQESKKQ